MYNLSLAVCAVYMNDTSNHAIHRGEVIRLVVNDEMSEKIIIL